MNTFMPAFEPCQPPMDIAFTRCVSHRIEPGRSFTYRGHTYRRKRLVKKKFKQSIQDYADELPSMFSGWIVDYNYGPCSTHDCMTTAITIYMPSMGTPREAHDCL